MPTPPTTPLQRSILLAALAAVCPATLAQPFLSSHSWWFPGGAPVSGSFSNSANWENFDLPITDESHYNALYMRSFPSPADFVAENDLQSGLRVGRLDVGNLGYTT